MFPCCVKAGGHPSRGIRGTLLQSDNANDEGDGIDFGVCEFEWVVLWVVRNDEDVLLVRSRLYALDNGPLLGVEDVWFVPLEEEVAHGYSLACHDVTGEIGWTHAISLYGHEEIRAVECRYHITLALILKNCLFSLKCSSHRTEWNEWNAFLIFLCNSEFICIFVVGRKLLISGGVV